MTTQKTNTEWIDTLDTTEIAPFDQLKDTVEATPENNQNTKLKIETYNLYTQSSHTDTVRIDDFDNSKIICADGQIRLFRLPNNETGHFNTQGGTDKMPDIVTSFMVVE
jgi:hypothetical protein